MRPSAGHYTWDTVHTPGWIPDIYTLEFFFFVVVVAVVSGGGYFAEKISNASFLMSFQFYSRRLKDIPRLALKKKINRSVSEQISHH